MLGEDYQEALFLNGYTSYEEFERLHLERGYGMDEIQTCWNNLLRQHEEEKHELLKDAVREQEEERRRQNQKDIIRGFR